MNKEEIFRKIMSMTPKEASYYENSSQYFDWLEKKIHFFSNGKEVCIYYYTGDNSNGEEYGKIVIKDFQEEVPKFWYFVDEEVPKFLEFFNSFMKKIRI